MFSGFFPFVDTIKTCSFLCQEIDNSQQDFFLCSLTLTFSHPVYILHQNQIQATFYLNKDNEDNDDNNNNNDENDNNDKNNDNNNDNENKDNENDDDKTSTATTMTM